ncbi:MAG: hypothetical protein RL367_647, partial [Pseudomonadota bacterium]
AQIATCPNAAPFDPKKLVFTNTATVFAPRKDLATLPFDLLFLSRTYRYFYVLTCRMSYLNMNRSHVYPTNLRLLPWNEVLAAVAARLEALRTPLVIACENHFRTEGAMFAALGALSLKPFRDVVKEAVKGSGGKVEWSESFLKGSEKVEIAGGCHAVPEGDGWTLQVSDYPYDHLTIPSEDAAFGLALALSARAGTAHKLVDRSMVLDMPIAPDAAARAEFARLVKDYHESDHAGAIDSVVDQIDALIGPALGLDSADIAAIRDDMTHDPFLKNITPRWPATQTRIHGYRTGLDQSERYA